MSYGNFKLQYKKESKQANQLSVDCMGPLSVNCIPVYDASVQNELELWALSGFNTIVYCYNAGSKQYKLHILTGFS